MTTFKTIKVTKDAPAPAPVPAPVPALSFDTALARFLASLPDQYAAQPGRTYVKILYTGNNGQQFVVCFVRKSDGAVLKGNWKQVEKPLTLRGNIYSAQHGMEAISASGHIKYLR